MDPPSVAGEQNLHRDRLVQGADRCPPVIRREFTPWSPAGVPASRHASPPVLFPRDCTSGTNSAITLRRAIDLDESRQRDGALRLRAAAVAMRETRQSCEAPGVALASMGERHSARNAAASVATTRKDQR